MKVFRSMRPSLATPNWHRLWLAATTPQPRKILVFPEENLHFSRIRSYKHLGTACKQHPPIPNFVYFSNALLHICRLLSGKRLGTTFSCFWALFWRPGSLLGPSGASPEASWPPPGALLPGFLAPQAATKLQKKQKKHKNVTS